MSIYPEDDGTTHINIYSKGLTPLGHMLSNFYKFPIHTKTDGDFMSVEAYWYWLSIVPCEEREKLRKCYGYFAKKTGEEILTIKNSARVEDFEYKILCAIWYKFRRQAHLITEQYKTLPFYHYYNYSGKTVDVTDKYWWMVQGISKMRDALVSK